MDSLDSFIVERRQRPRIVVESAARLRPNDWSTTQVDMVDISAEGFRATGEISFRIGAFLSLQVPGIGWVEATIVWQNLGHFGAKFIFPIDLAHCAWTSAPEAPCDHSAALGRQLASRVMIDEPRPDVGQALG